MPEVAASVQAALASGHLSGNGPLGQQCEAFLSQLFGATVLLTSSATHALEMMAILSGVGPDDEVILPSYTFPSTGNAFALRGARLRFADNDRFGNIAIGEVKRLLSQRTRAVVAVHYAGASAMLDELSELCRAHCVYLFEDAAQAIGGDYQDRRLGTWGALACLSFHETKNVGCGEGGALIVNDERFRERAEVIREKGTNRKAYFQGLVDKYTWVDIGSSYILSDLNAAYLYPQLLQLDAIIARRGALWTRYRRELRAPLARIGALTLEIPAYNRPNYHLFAIVMPDTATRREFIEHMRARQILCPFHYASLHLSSFGRRQYDGPPEVLPECERFSDCLVRLPLYYNLEGDEQTRVIDAILGWLATR